MQWIERNKKKFWVLEGTAFTCIAVMLLYYRDSGSNVIERWQLGLMILPFFIGFLGWIPLTYLSWFGSQSSSASMKIIAKKAFFWLFVCGMFATFIVIYGIFVFN